MNRITEKLFEYSRVTYSVVPDNPFSSYPSVSVLRHPDTRKWFALIMDVQRSRLGLSGDEKVDILNIKCDPILGGSLRLSDGYYPAYHMNHEGWLTVLLDGTVPVEDIYPLLDLSFELTMKKPKKKKKKKKKE